MWPEVPWRTWLLLLLPLVATAAAPRGVEQRNHGDMLGCGEPRVVIPPSSKLPEGNLTLIAQDKSKGVTWVVRVDQPAASKNSGFQAGRSGAALLVVQLGEAGLSGDSLTCTYAWFPNPTQAAPWLCPSTSLLLAMRQRVVARQGKLLRLLTWPAERPALRHCRHPQQTFGHMARHGHGRVAFW